jgi:heme/copper-type cytochrome/quinol oxidase subunit 2
MKRNLLIALLLILSTSVFAQDQNIAAIVDEKTHQIDIVFISKIIVMLFIGVIALLTYFNFRKSER